MANEPKSDDKDEPVKLPCPFCGGRVDMHYTGSSDWEVICRGNCEVETRFWVSAPKYGYGKGEHHEAIRRWNTRAPLPECGTRLLDALDRMIESCGEDIRKEDTGNHMTIAALSGELKGLMAARKYAELNAARSTSGAFSAIGTTSTKEKT